MQSACSRSRTPNLTGVSNILAPTVVNHLMVTTVSVVTILKCSINRIKMETRNIQISLDRAREWYHSDSKSLRNLALCAFTEEELTEPQTFEEVLNSLGLASVEIEVTGKTKVDYKNVIPSILKKERVNIKLAIIADYFNKGWKPGIRERKFLIGWGTSYSPTAVILENGFYVNFHEIVRYPGIIYFKTQEDAIRAFNMLKDELKALYRYE